MSYGDLAVIHDVSFAIGPGTFIGVVGPNGAGKSTLLLALSGQFRPDSGKITFAGQDIYENNLQFKRQIGFVHESPFFYPNLTAFEIMQFVADAKGVDTEKQKEEIERLLEQVLLIENQAKLTSELSMGMRKKLAIACAFLGSPKIVFLDEALNGVDFESTFHIKTLLKNFVAAGGTIVLSTHVLEIIEKLCERLVILRQGKLIEDWDAQQMALLKSENDGFDLETYLVDKLSKPQPPE